MATNSSNWPGEWHPARNDVALASEAPDPAQLADFKTRLLASDHARGIQDLMHIDLSKSRLANEYTYPLALLSDLPPIPEHFELLRLWQVFLNHRSELAFVNLIPIALGSRETVAPHLLLAAASFALLAEGDGQRAKDAFVAAMGVWSVMIEIDNREARTEESLIAGTLLFLFGSLQSDIAVNRWPRMLNYAVITIARRRRLHDYCLLEDKFLLNLHKPTIAMLWLADLLQALDLNAPMNFSTQEINISMIDSLHNMQDLRAALLRNERVPHEVESGEDALLLLIGILTDSIYLQRSLGPYAGFQDPINPFVPLSPHTEQQRMLSVLSLGLDRWSESFDSIRSDIMVLYHYCRLYLTFPEVTGLASRIGYPVANKNSKHDFKVPDTAAKFAWRILDAAAAADSVQGPKFCSPWLPVTTFHAALVIWTEIAISASVNAPSKRILVPFIFELQKMGWPCCVNMVSTLQMLVDAGNG